MVADGAARASVCCFMSIRSIRGPNGRIGDYAVLGGLAQQQRSVAVAEKPEIIVEGIAIDVAPAFSAHKCRYQQKQGGLRLVEVGDHSAYHVELE